MASKVAIVYGGAGALGRGIVHAFKNNSWKVLSVDINANDEATQNITLSLSDSWQVSSDKVLSSVEQHLGTEKVHAILNVAGGWAGGNIASADVIKNSELMWSQSVHSSIIAAQLASKVLSDDGLLLLTGAYAAINGTPGMIAYGIAKAAVHQLVKSLGSKDSGLPSNSVTVGILPITLDTPANRKFAAPGTDFSSWTPIDAIAAKVLSWSNGEAKPKTGELIQVITVNNETSFNVVA